MTETQGVFDIDSISIFIVDEKAKAEIRDDYVETAELELLVRLHDNSNGITYKYRVWVECDYRDDWRIYMLGLFLGDFMPYFERAYDKDGGYWVVADRTSEDEDVTK